MNHSSKTNITSEISKVKGSMHNNPRAKAGEGGGCSRRVQSASNRCAQAAVHLLGTAAPEGKHKDPLMRMPPTSENVSTQNVRFKRKKRKNPKTHNPTDHPAITTILNHRHFFSFYKKINKKY